YRSRPLQPVARRPANEPLWFILLVAIPSLYAALWLRQRFGLDDLDVMQDRINAMADATLFLLLAAGAAVVPAYWIQRSASFQAHRPRGFVLSIVLIALLAFLVLWTGNRNTVFIAV